MPSDGLLCFANFFRLFPSLSLAAAAGYPLVARLQRIGAAFGDCVAGKFISSLLLDSSVDTATLLSCSCCSLLLVAVPLVFAARVLRDVGDGGGVVAPMPTDAAALLGVEDFPGCLSTLPDVVAPFARNFLVLVLLNTGDFDSSSSLALSDAVDDDRVGSSLALLCLVLLVLLNTGDFDSSFSFALSDAVDDDGVGDLPLVILSLLVLIAKTTRCSQA